MYNSDLNGYHSPVTNPEPLTGDVLPAPTPAPPEHTPQGRPLYWHVYGGPLKGTKGAAKNFPMITAGPVTKPPDAEVTGTTIPGADGVTVFSYLGTFDHDPSEAELRSLRPKAYR